MSDRTVSPSAATASRANNLPSGSVNASAGAFWPIVNTFTTQPPTQAEIARQEAQERYDATRTHRALVALQDATLRCLREGVQ